MVSSSRVVQPDARTRKLLFAVLLIEVAELALYNIDLSLAELSHFTLARCLASVLCHTLRTALLLPSVYKLFCAV